MFSRGYLLGWGWEIGLSSPESLFPALAFSAFVLRFRCINARISSCILYFKGNATASQLTDFIPPIIVTVIAWAVTGKLLGINIATLFSFLGNGVMIAWADEHIWPQLQHNFKVKATR